MRDIVIMINQVDLFVFLSYGVQDQARGTIIMINDVGRCAFLYFSEIENQRWRPGLNAGHYYHDSHMTHAYFYGVRRGC